VSGRIEIRFTAGEGALARMLGLVERRGFDIRGVAMAEGPTEARIAMDVEARDPLRRLDVLTRQLERLIDVRSASFSSRQAGTGE
jgi:acetolactate synthase II small subunit